MKGGDRIRNVLLLGFVALTILEAMAQGGETFLDGYSPLPRVAELESECYELDELGGQPSLTLAITKDVDAWAKKNLPNTPRYYLASVPKRKLAQDFVAKKRQDKMMSGLKALRTTIMNAYGQCLALEIDTTDFTQIVANYCEVISSRNWKDIGDRTPQKSSNAEKWLHSRIYVKGYENLVHVYTKICLIKKARYQDFAAKHPETAQTALAVQRAKKAEERAAKAEVKAQQAEVAAEEAERRAAFAESAAAEAQRRADAANRRAADAQFQLNTSMRW